jgi:hypothetical protein
MTSLDFPKVGDLTYLARHDGAGSGVAVAIPIHNIDGRRHVNNVNEILNLLASGQRPVYQDIGVAQSTSL